MISCNKMLTVCKEYILQLRNVIIILVLIFIVVNFGSDEDNKKVTMKDFPSSALKYLISKYENVSQLTPEQTRKRIIEHNYKEHIQNEDTFGPLKSDAIIIVINVRELTKSLRYLIVSLSQVRGIEDTLLIFSHSLYDVNINKLIHDIDFCLVLQIFYPYSVQTYPNHFPGYQAGDCDYDVPVTIAESSNCTGAFTPDIHGRYRHPVMAEKKHHWWWTANKVFENLTCTEQHEGLVMFVDPSTFVMEDLVFMAISMNKKTESIPQCDFLSLGTNLPVKNKRKDSYAFEVEIRSWDPQLHSNVLAFDLYTWNSISAHYDIFCNFDDYSWSQSLYFMSLNRRDNKPYVAMSTVLPRGFPSLPYWMTTWILVDVEESIYFILELQRRFKEFLFPSHLEIRSRKVIEDEDVIFDHAQKNGYWSDPRDRQLCVDLTISKIKKVLLDMKNEFNDFTSAPVSTP